MSPSSPRSSPSRSGELGTGRLLVATPELVDPNFSRSVILLLDHGEGGAFGVVLNRPSDAPVGAVLEPWAAVAADPAVVFVGGPVGADQAMGLVRGTARDPGWTGILGDLGTVDLDADADRFAPGVLRLFVGYAGWGAGQLESEIAEGSWFVVGSDLPADVLTPDPDRLWATVLRRQGGRLAWFANSPVDLSSN